MKKLVLLLIFLTIAFPARAAFDTREEMRAAFPAPSPALQAGLFEEAPSVRPPFAAGSLKEAVLEDALRDLNYLRQLAGLDEVSLDPLWNLRCQHGAVLLAALETVTHEPVRPDGMPEEFFLTAESAAQSSNVARLNWMRPTILRECVEYFVRDDGDANLLELGHRRWALNPEMSLTGFGLASSASGMSYSVMYAHDLGASPDWTSVRWPSEGWFPVEMMHADLAWSIVLNPAVYDLSASLPSISLWEERLGLFFHFHPDFSEGDGCSAVRDDGYGAGPCLIFRPDFSETNFTDYEQNQCWHVRVDGLRRRDGAVETMEYAVQMASLYPQDVVNVEITPMEATLAVGQTLTASAAVVPSYADDLTVAWRSEDETVATVDDAGRVTAVGPGQCAIAVVSANGREDRLALTVVP